MLKRTSKLLLSLGLGAALSGLMPALGALMSGCDGASDSTSGRRVALQAEVRLAAAASQPFTNAFGYTVSLSYLRLSIGELRYYSGEPIGRLRPPGGPSPLGLRSAWAHPGHYKAGDVLGEMLTPLTVDLLAGTTGLARGEGVTGDYLSASFSFHTPAAGDLGAELGEDIVLLLRGESTKAEQRFTFEATVLRSEVLDTYGEPIVAGCPFSDGAVEGNGTVVLTVDPSLWLDQVDFAEVPASPDGGPVALNHQEAPHKSLVRGLKKAAAYSFLFLPESREST